MAKFLVVSSIIIRWYYNCSYSYNKAITKENTKNETQALDSPGVDGSASAANRCSLPRRGQREVASLNLNCCVSGYPLTCSARVQDHVPAGHLRFAPLRIFFKLKFSDWSSLRLLDNSCTSNQKKEKNVVTMDIAARLWTLVVVTAAVRGVHIHFVEKDMQSKPATLGSRRALLGFLHPRRGSTVFVHFPLSFAMF